MRTKEQILEAANVMAGKSDLSDDFIENLDVMLKAQHRIGVQPWSENDILLLMIFSGMNLAIDKPKPIPKPIVPPAPVDWNKVPQGTKVDLASGSRGVFLGIKEGMAIIRVGNEPEPIKLPVGSGAFVMAGQAS